MSAFNSGRRDFLRRTGGLLVAVVDGCVPDLNDVYNGFIDENPVTDPDMVYDFGLPPEGDSRYAQKIFGFNGALSNIGGNSTQNLLYGPDWRPENRYTRFITTQKTPLEIAVAFAKPFKRVTLATRQEDDLYVEGWSGVPLTLAKPLEPTIFGFLPDRDRHEEGVVAAHSINSTAGGGGITIDTGYTPERVFLFRAKPNSPNVFGTDIYIDYLIIDAY